MRRAATATAGLLFWSTTALADWVYQLDDDPFVESGGSHIAVVGDLIGYGAGFRCAAPDDLTLIFITPERARDVESALFVQLPAILLVVIDDADKVYLDARIDVTPNGETYRFLSDEMAVSAVFRAALTAKKRFAVAAQISGQIFHRKSFDVRGSSRALKQLVEGCKLNTENER